MINPKAEVFKHSTDESDSAAAQCGGKAAKRDRS
jgi:hypothetical protein